MLNDNATKLKCFELPKIHRFVLCVICFEYKIGYVLTIYIDFKYFFVRGGHTNNDASFTNPTIKCDD